MNKENTQIQIKSDRGGYELEPKIVGGFGEKKSNNGTQWYQQDRVYSTETVAMCHPANIPEGSYKYLVKEYVYDEQNQYVRKDNLVGTLTTDGSSPKHNSRIIECWLSDKGKKYILSPKRGMCTDINAEICQPITAKGQSNWTGSFVSPDIKKITRSNEIGGVKPTKIETYDGEVFTSDDEEKIQKYHIRKLTPKECWRLMGFDDGDFDKAENVNSNSQLYKQAGNSIVVNVLEAIFGEMF